MPRYIRNTVILAKLETSYGSDPTPTGAANAILVSDVTINPLTAANVPRDLVRGYFGGSEHLVGTAYLECSFSVELQGGGAAATAAPAWSPLLQACGFAAAATAGAYEHTPISAFGSNSSVTIYYYLDGELYKMLGARGTFTIDLGMGARPVMKFRFIGKNGGLTATGNATPTLSAFKTPVAVTDTNTGDVTLGCTYTASSGTISSGTAYTSKGVQIDIGNALNFHPLLGGETCDITARDASADLSLDLSAADAATFFSAVAANTMTSLGITHGSGTGYVVVIYAPNVQRIDPGIEDMDGMALHTYKLRLTPSTGNDEIRIVTR
jgi:hypothetical protein